MNRPGESNKAGASSPSAPLLGGRHSIALVAGSMLGIGIFITPSQVAQQIDSSFWFFGVWILGGLSAFFGALCLAEIGTMLPMSGGDYHYLRLSYGRGIAFAAGWLQLLAIYPGSLASMALATSKYQMPVLFGDGVTQPIDVLGVAIPGPTVCAVLIIVAFSAVNHLGVELSGRIQVLLTTVPILVLAGVSAWVLLGDIPSASEANIKISPVPPSTSGGFPGWEAVAFAYLPVYFAYSGWNAILYVGGEVREPGRTIPLALLGGTAIVIVLYGLLCGGFIHVLGMDALKEVGEAGTAAGVALFGSNGRMAITWLIVFGMLGSINGSVMSGSRVGHAMATDGRCFPFVRKLSRFKTPAAAIWLQAVISIAALALGAQLDELIAYTSSAMLITGTLTVMTVVVLRKKMPDRARPFRTWLVPWIPLAYSAGCTAIFVIALLGDSGDSGASRFSVAIAALWFVLAWVVHRVLFSREVREP